VKILQLIAEPVLSFLVNVDVPPVLCPVKGQFVSRFHKRFHIKRTPFPPVVEVDVRIQHAGLRKRKPVRGAAENRFVVHKQAYMLHPVYVGLTVHPVVCFHAHADASPCADGFSGAQGIPRFIFPDRHPERAAAAVHHSFSLQGVNGDSPQVRFLRVGYRRQECQGIQRLLRVCIAQFEMKVRATGAPGISAQRNLFASFDRESIFFQMKIHRITLLLILLFEYVIGNLSGKAVEVCIHAGVPCGRMINIKSQPVSAGGDTDTRHVAIFNG